MSFSIPSSTAVEGRSDKLHPDSSSQNPPAHTGKIRAILEEHARLSVPVEGLADSGDLYAAGLTSLTTVSVMLALEDFFQVEFPDRMLGRKTFESIQSISEAIAELLA